MFLFLKEFVADPTCATMTVQEHHERTQQSWNASEYGLYTYHELMLKFGGYKYAEGKTYVESLTSNVKPKPHKDKAYAKIEAMKQYRILNALVEGSRNESTHKQGATLSGHVSTTQAAKAILATQEKDFRRFQNPALAAFAADDDEDGPKVKKEKKERKDPKEKKEKKEHEQKDPEKFLNKINKDLLECKKLRSDMSGSLIRNDQALCAALESYATKGKVLADKLEKAICDNDKVTEALNAWHAAQHAGQPLHSFKDDIAMARKRKRAMEAETKGKNKAT